MSTDGEITHLAGAPSDCDCKVQENSNFRLVFSSQSLYIQSCSLQQFENEYKTDKGWHLASKLVILLTFLLLSSVLQNDANCDCYQTGDGYAKDARLNCPSSLVVSPDGTLYVADLGNIRIRAIRCNQPPTGMID